jgi:hypothetical protein
LSRNFLFFATSSIFNVRFAILIVIT